MELKKSKKADLENKRGIFFQTGLVLVLAICIAAFEWEKSEESVSSLGTLSDMIIEEEIIPITRQEEIKAPPPPPSVIEELNIVEDDKEIENEIEIKDSEADQTTVVEKVEIVAEAEEEDNEVYEFFVLEEKPTFPGGEAALLKWIAQNTKYPEIAKENGIQGRVFVGFVIDKAGNVIDVKILRGVDPYLDKEAMRVVKAMPDWAPGKQRGKSVKVSYQVPINFKLY
jgi:periplasmic protein TonB